MGFGNLLIYLLFHFGKAHIIPKGVCMRKFNGSTLLTTYCCQHYFNESGRCQECPNGFSSTGGGPCLPCSKGSYGLRCKEKCLCNTDERCHHIDGCMQIEDANLELFNDPQPSTQAHAKQENSKDQIDTVLIYIICSGGLIFLIGLSALIHRYQPSGICEGKELKIKTEIVTTDSEAIESIPGTEINESIYNIIEDEDMIETMNT